MSYLLFVNERKPAALDLARRLADRWDAASVPWAPCEGSDAEALGREPSASLGAGGGVTGIVLGGDGTLLRAARMAPTVPLMVVNFGTVGFLAAVEPDEVDAALEDLEAGRLSVEERLTLDVRIDGGPAQRATNEVVVGRRQSRRTIEIAVEVDGEPFWRWTADGVLVASPTGSTAYALSAGGPLVVPGADVLTVVPICAHTLLSRSIVLPASSTVRIVPSDASGDDVAVTADGTTLATGPFGSATVTRSAHPLRLVARGTGRFSRLRMKLVDWSTQGGQE